MKNIFNGLKSLSRFWQLPAEKQMAVTLDEEQVYFCQLTLPMMPAKEVAEAVRWELPLHVPYAEGSFYYDYKILGNSDGMQNILVAVILKKLFAELDEAAQTQDLILTSVNVAGYEEQGFNLVPDALKRKRVPLAKLYGLGTVSVLVLGALLISGGWCYKMVQASRLQKVQAQIQNLSLWQKRYEEQEARSQKIKVFSEALQKLERERLLWSKVLPALGSSTPENCWLTNIKQREASKIVEVYGKAKSMEEVKKLLGNLQESKNFSKVTLAETNANKENNLGYKIILQGREK